LPVQVSRSAWLGPKPARQNRRSTIAVVSGSWPGGIGGGGSGSVGVGATSPAGGAGAGPAATGAIDGNVFVVGAGSLAFGTFTRRLDVGAPAFCFLSSARTL
jgi:hypothetical protein